MGRKPRELTGEIGNWRGRGRARRAQRKRQAAPNGQVAGKSARKLTDQRRLVWFSQIYGADTSVTHHPLKPES